MVNKQIASQILDYWFAIEFLGQDSYEICTDERKLVRELEQFKKSASCVRERCKQISVFEKVNCESGIYKQIVDQAKECGMRFWGNLTFYIGSIRRQVCIEHLAQKLGMELEQAEKNYEYIPVLSFQCTADGIYIKHSLSLSTIIWAISQVEDKKDRDLSTLLSRKAYSKAVEELETKFFESDDLHNQDDTELTSVKYNMEGMPAFAVDAIDTSKIISIYNEIVKIYGKCFSENALEEKNGLKYQLFKDAEVKDKYDDVNYMGLSHDFFSDDLKMVKISLEKGKDNYETGMLSDLIDYICAPHEAVGKRKRHDFVRPVHKEVFSEELFEILNIANSPLGKWPSRYMPALMQQVAVNIAISNHQRGIFEEIGNIFSVNGPPGTGKTTLLKEIIANNIVEKAEFLSRYEQPEDAFERVKFRGGKLEGKYSQYFPVWYRFKHENIANYGVLVTSCNNTAVENITKELPLESGILDNLKTVSGGPTPDSPEMTRQLEAIRALFSTTETEEKINIYQKDTSRQGEYPEIYFTGYARKFLGNSKKDADAWGLIAAPLGKKSNIIRFYYDVLNPICQDFLMKNDDIENRIPKYRKAKDVFTKQLEKVKRIQKTLKKYGDVSYHSHQLRVAYEQTQSKNNDLIASVEAKNKTLEQKLTDIDIEIKKYINNVKTLTTLFNDMDFKVKESERKIQDLSEQKLNYQKQALDVEKSVGFFTKLIRKSKYQSAMDLVGSLREKARECEAAISQELRLLDTERVEAEKCRSNKEGASQKLQEKRKREKEIQDQQFKNMNSINHLKEEIDLARNRAEAAKTECKTRLKEYFCADDMKTGKVLNEAFIEDILSKDDKVSAKAQISNPWSTEEFNRERERLFYLALQMTKEFVLSSKSCRTNLCILGQYWGLRTEKDTDGKKIEFDEQDSKAMISSLFQTLFLLTPVISSTFASVGRLLKDMKAPGCIGTLVIDEAGQAQPQMAVGALYRARRAIIVGDPKQVEPVVTDDLKLLKEAYSEPLFANYKNKSLSVQSCADILNPFGAFFNNGTNDPDWVGCPLLVHRRCISPMYEISNRISYDGIMKQQTLPPSKDKCSSFICSKSQWINVHGKEKGSGDHYVAEQGDRICKMVDFAFQKAMKQYSGTRSDAKPKLYIITPFTSVVRGLRNAIKTYASENQKTALAKSRSLDEWLDKNIGTVHKFQGKEANEVIFVLGCDESQKDRYAVTGFVNSNIVNVAATRAKYRLYIVGDSNVWNRNKFVKEAKAIIDTTP